jgi:hypothetical protein
MSTGTFKPGRRRRAAIVEDVRTLATLLSKGKAIDNRTVENYNTALGARPVPWDALWDSWLGHALRLCLKENRPDVVKTLLRMLFARIGAGVVDADALIAFEDEVFRDYPKSGAGRKVSSERDSILKTWRRLGEPSLTRHTLAWKLHGTRFERADPAMKRKLVNRHRQAVKRALEAERQRKAATAPISAKIFP